MREVLSAICRSLDVPIWSKLSEGRRKLCERRAREEGWDQIGFLAGVQDVLLSTPKSYMEGWPEPNRTLDVLLRVPQRGNPDHFQRIREMLADREPEVDPDEEAADALFG